ncbi:hsp40 co-chaperone jid1 [Trichoderma cornu-damae]|uniref:Hsp40 co-chaperone jid1 n=1 Tax=Trichoderma cornu-damae TaxID=654480 RepID=A0A9P8TW93_9HYPO|nr:hsp40 co-chaperone jid1 [Trichoderma cornu-damae]
MAFKPAVAVLPSLVSPLCGSHHCIPHCARSPPSPLCERLKRRYATASDTNDRKWSDPKSSPDDDMPEWPKTPRPTPYQVLGVSKGAVYDKRRFYRLVKLYHPDTHDHRDHHHHSSPSSSSSSHINKLPRSTRLERYRMIVAANELLSNSAKRRMYDAYGLGWSHGDGAAPLRDVDRSWRHQEGSAANNATWEDWERWREARDGKSSEPVYMSHRAFASVLVLMCLVGAMAQTNRADTSGAQYVGWAADQSAEIGGRLRRNGSTVAGLSKDERVDYFLRERENVNYHFVPAKHETSDPPRPS